MVSGMALAVKEKDLDLMVVARGQAAVLEDQRELAAMCSDHRLSLAGVESAVACL